MNRTLSLINTAADQDNTWEGQVSSAAQILTFGAAEQMATVEK
jgi:hypothetical protein